MAGIRIRHPTARSGMFLVKHYRRYPQPMVCPTCKTVHLQKTYHLELDDSGATIVSPEVLERLKEVGLAGFSIENEVARPPARTINIPNVLYNRFRIMPIGARKHGSKESV